ncbi:CHDH [Mytilus edulis]|uniref:Choline dehydrogenase n=1 Tax=Mytilus edulis TaxID=6550 RepID=A0A8S3VEU1_MYTED|nr:CHDH [Mytilus edulis]
MAQIGVRRFRDLRRLEKCGKQLLTRTSRLKPKDQHHNLLPCRTVSGSNQYRNRSQTMKSVTPTHNKKVQLVILDKDGTLICFHSMWAPWSRKLAAKLETATGLNIEDKIFETLGFCSETETIQPGLLAEATTSIIKDELAKMLINEGVDEDEVRGILDQNWEEGENKNPKHLKSVGDLKTLFEILKKNDIKIAVCTADNREGSLAGLAELGLKDYIDVLICGDDPHTEAKPAPHNAWKICKELGVDPKQTVMVGDTQTDILIFEEKTGLKIGPLIADTLGYCEMTKKVSEGVLSEGTWYEIKKSMVDVVRKQGIPYQEAVILTNQVIKECEHIWYQDSKTLNKDIKEFFQLLKNAGMKIAVSAADERDNVFKEFQNLGVMNYIDFLLCDGDPHAITPLGRHNIEFICEQLDIDPSETVLVGDATADFINVDTTKCIGVLTGVASKQQLEDHTDIIVESVDDVLDHVIGTSPSLPPQSPRQPSRQSAPMSMAGGPFSTIKRSFSTSTSRHYSTKSDISSVHDYVIVGAGSAGCVLANRLSANEENKVLVLEAGPKDYTWKIHMPAALMYNLCDDNYNWYYHTEPEKGMNDRVMYWPRGRVWGGSSSLNAMVYIRGNALDYDGWEKLGATSWSYADCLPYFRKAQCHELGENDYRGGSGPLHVSRGKNKNPLFQAFIDAGVEAGYPFTDDMNGYQQEGLGWMDMTIHKGLRWSAASAYLRPANKRNNLTAEVKALTNRIIFDNNRAVGVEYEQGGVVKRAMANKEVILSGGAINSPQLLMLSGIGNADDLKKLNIPVVQNLPGVGENLQDHLEVYVQYELTQPLSLYKAQWKFPHNMIRIGLQWFATQKGDGASAHLESGGFIRSRAGVEFPDIQFHFLPSTVNDHGRKMGDRHACQVHVGTLRPTSRGHIKLKSNNPRDHPKLVANYMSTQDDIEDMRNSVRLAREIFQQKAFQPYVGPELNPGSKVQSDAEIDEYVRRMGDSAYHPSCTCKMGSPSDTMTVVDPETKVLGIEGLRVVDASIMPAMVSGNLNGPTIMVAEKAADIILGNKPLPKSNAPVYRPKTLETQR